MSLKSEADSVSLPPLPTHRPPLGSRRLPLTLGQGPRIQHPQARTSEDHSTCRGRSQAGCFAIINNFLSLCLPQTCSTSLPRTAEQADI